MTREPINGQPPKFPPPSSGVCPMCGGPVTVTPQKYGPSKLTHEPHTLDVNRLAHVLEATWWSGDRDGASVAAGDIAAEYAGLSEPTR